MSAIAAISQAALEGLAVDTLLQGLGRVFTFARNPYSPAMNATTVNGARVGDAATEEYIRSGGQVGAARGEAPRATDGVQVYVCGVDGQGNAIECGPSGSEGSPAGGSTEGNDAWGAGGQSLWDRIQAFLERGAVFILGAVIIVLALYVLMRSTGLVTPVQRSRVEHIVKQAPTKVSAPKARAPKPPKAPRSKAVTGAPAPLQLEGPK